MSFLINPYRFGRLWTPADITTALWLDAADASTVTTVSGAVSQWNDKSGNGIHATQSAVASRPAYTTSAINNLAVVEGDGVNDFLQTATTPMHNQANFYISMVVKRNETGSGCFLGNRSYESSEVRGFSILFADTTGSYGINASSIAIANGTGLNQNSFRSTPTSSFSSGSTGNIELQWQNGSTPMTWINGNNQTLTNWTPFTPTNTQVWRAVDPGIGILNSNVSYSSEPAQAQIGEIVVINQVISTNTRQQVEGYLAWKWGLVANLPSDHPYKSAAPKV